MSRLVRCVQCFRNGPVPPYPEALAWTKPRVLEDATERQRRNNLASFDELEPNLVLHVALTGHNDWDTLHPRYGPGWHHLGPYLGGGYFEADEGSDERVGKG